MIVPATNTSPPTHKFLPIPTPPATLNAAEDVEVARVTFVTVVKPTNIEVPVTFKLPPTPNAPLAATFPLSTEVPVTFKLPLTPRLALIATLPPNVEPLVTNKLPDVVTPVTARPPPTVVLPPIPRSLAKYDAPFTPRPLALTINAC